MRLAPPRHPAGCWFGRDVCWVSPRGGGGIGWRSCTNALLACRIQSPVPGHCSTSEGVLRGRHTEEEREEQEEGGGEEVCVFFGGGCGIRVFWDVYLRGGGGGGGGHTLSRTCSLAGFMQKRNNTVLTRCVRAKELRYYTGRFFTSFPPPPSLPPPPPPPPVTFCLADGPCCRQFAVACSTAGQRGRRCCHVRSPYLLPPPLLQIICGGMQHVGVAQMAAAVSNAGGLGILTGLTQRVYPGIRTCACLRLGPLLRARVAFRPRAGTDLSRVRPCCAPSPSQADARGPARRDPKDAHAHGQFRNSRALARSLAAPVVRCPRAGRLVVCWRSATTGPQSTRAGHASAG